MTALRFAKNDIEYHLLKRRLRFLRDLEKCYVSEPPADKIGDGRLAGLSDVNTRDKLIERLQKIDENDTI